MDSTANSNDIIIVSSSSDSSVTINSCLTDSLTIDLNNYASDSMIGSNLGNITLNNITITDTISNWTFTETVPFQDGFPEWNDFQKMCKEYPGLEKTFEHLKSYYNMCKDDWESKKTDDV
jgi:hypothetical protein